MPDTILTTGAPTETGPAAAGPRAWTRAPAAPHLHRRDRDARDMLHHVVTGRRPELLEHMIAVGAMAAQVAARLEVPFQVQADIRLAGELHDVGKLLVSATILDKRSALDPREWAQVRRHSAAGERILLNHGLGTHVTRIVRHHHERIDGRGYPDGLAGCKIPLGARIVAACDAYDSMISERPYSEPVPAHVALGRLRDGAGSQFDAEAVEAIASLTSRARVTQLPY